MEMAQRLADIGHIMLLLDLFYRNGSYEPFVPAKMLKGNF
jgi:dienelactone hydrolase